MPLGEWDAALSRVHVSLPFDQLVLKALARGLHFAMGGTAAVAIGLATQGISPASADSESSFFQNKTVSLIVGFPPGGGYDAYARLLARYYGTHIPGSPSMVVRNMAGASGVLSGNYLYEVAPRDGSTSKPVFGTSPSSLAGSGVSTPQIA
jgi:tripartite-type tricarboxylate transporter receptor subunit TctC